jgi:hypothetical protein
MGDESQKWIDAPSIEEAYAIYTQRHGAPVSEHVVIPEGYSAPTALLTYEVENGNNPYKLHLTVHEWRLTA